MTNVVLSKNKRCQLFMPEGLVLPEGVSTVQILNPPRYGVIRWVGELPNTKGVIAGVELVSTGESACTLSVCVFVHAKSCDLRMLHVYPGESY